MVAGQGQTDAFIAVGSNIDPERNIRSAIALLAEHARLTGISTFYRTTALGRAAQDMFLNGVCSIAATMAPRTLKFEVLRRIEKELGRVRSEDKYAPRTIDLDIAVFGSLVVDESDLTIPDPDVRRRVFVAVPLLEIAPDLVLPDSGQPLQEIARAMNAESLAPAEAFTNSLRVRFMQ